MLEVKDILLGLRCETCSKERLFGNIPNSEPDNLYVYNDLSGTTRCFCKEHMTFFTKTGGMTNIKDKNAKVGFGAKLISEILNLSCSTGAYTPKKEGDEL